MKMIPTMITSMDVIYSVLIKGTDIYFWQDYYLYIVHKKLNEGYELYI